MPVVPSPRRRNSRKKSLARLPRLLDYGDDAVSVSIEDVAPKDWAEKVYRPYIADKSEQLYKKPGYNPL